MFLGQKIGCPSYDLSHLNRLLLTQNYDLQTFKFHFGEIIRSCVTTFLKFVFIQTLTPSAPNYLERRTWL